jgi:ABC-type transport system involved in multi-copper enzyme maturation permease subunit
MKHIGWLAIIPFIGMFVGPIFHNSVTPFIFGLPFILGWIVIWVLLTSAIMAVINWLDPVRLIDEEDAR